MPSVSDAGLDLRTVWRDQAGCLLNFGENFQLFVPINRLVELAAEHLEGGIVYVKQYGVTEPAAFNKTICRDEFAAVRPDRSSC